MFCSCTTYVRILPVWRFSCLCNKTTSFHSVQHTPYPKICKSNTSHSQFTQISMHVYGTTLSFFNMSNCLPVMCLFILILPVMFPCKSSLVTDRLGTSGWQFYKHKSNLSPTSITFHQ